MVEEVILRELKKKLEVPVLMEVPADPPASFVIVEKTGSSITDQVSTALIAVQSYGESLYKAAKLNEDVKNAMLEDVAQADEIGGIHLNSDYNYTDSTTRKYRYQAVFDVTHY